MIEGATGSKSSRPVGSSRFRLRVSVRGGSVTVGVDMKQGEQASAERLGSLASLTYRKLRVGNIT